MTCEKHTGNAMNASDSNGGSLPPYLEDLVGDKMEELWQANRRPLPQNSIADFVAAEKEKGNKQEERIAALNSYLSLLPADDESFLNFFQAINIDSDEKDLDHPTVLHAMANKYSQLPASFWEIYRPLDGGSCRDTLAPDFDGQNFCDTILGHLQHPLIQERIARDLADLATGSELQGYTNLYTTYPAYWVAAGKDFNVFPQILIFLGNSGRDLNDVFKKISSGLTGKKETYFLQKFAIYEIFLGFIASVTTKENKPATECLNNLVADVKNTIQTRLFFHSVLEYINRKTGEE